MTECQGPFTVKWYDPRQGGRLQDGTVTSVRGGAQSLLGNPPDQTSADWIVLVCKDRPSYRQRRARYPSWVDQYDVVWDSQSKNSSASMPVVGGNLGCNVWVENNEILFYFSSPGARDENGSLMKFGRMRIRFEPDIFNQAEFKQVLKLSNGAVTIEAVSAEHVKTKVKLWVELHRPIVHTDIESESKVVVKATYENWRTEALFLPYSFSGHKQRGLSYGNYPAYDGDVYIYPDEFEPSETAMVFYHRMREDKCFFPMQIAQQGLTEIKDQLWNPLTNLTFGGIFTGDFLKFVKTTDGQYGQTKFRGWQYETSKPAKHIKLKLFTTSTRRKHPKNGSSSLRQSSQTQETMRPYGRRTCSGGKRSGAAAIS